MSHKKLKILTALHKLITFLEPYLPVVNAHLVHFYSDDEWNRLDIGLQSDLLVLDETQLGNLPRNFLESNFEGDFQIARAHTNNEADRKRAEASI